jgi:hypothetical protein
MWAGGPGDDGRKASRDGGWRKAAAGTGFRAAARQPVAVADLVTLFANRCGVCDRIGHSVRRAFDFRARDGLQV